MISSWKKVWEVEKIHQSRRVLNNLRQSGKKEESSFSYSSRYGCCDSIPIMCLNTQPVSMPKQYDSLSKFKCGTSESQRA